MQSEDEMSTELRCRVLATVVEYAVVGGLYTMLCGGGS